ncbi:MAG TPA: ATP-binding cassette domain-containing protein [Polyangiaceae bacterium]|nr:ATP-binding cassette domain-containing protein [Polyangiaceae bacterium]
MSHSPVQAAVGADPIELDAVGVSFGDTVALAGISLSVKRGEIAVIIGGSGAGKTTLARVIVGLLQPTSGTVFIEGENMTAMDGRELRRVRAKFGMVFQYSALLDSMTVLDNVGLPLLEHEKLSRSDVDERARRMLERLELTGCEDLLPSQISGGMRKRVALARALIRRPSILVYDEPASGLDPLAARHVDDLIRSTRDRFEVTSVVITHDMTQAFSLATCLHVLDKGRLVASGAPAELRQQVGSLAARYFEASRPSA